MAIAGAKIAVQGLDNVGGVAAHLFAEADSKVVAVQDHGGTIIHTNGLDVPQLLAHVADIASVAGLTGAEATMPNADFYNVDCEIFDSSCIRATN
jgi:glutamate dehydrogenase (NAD(P)+)